MPLLPQEVQQQGIGVEKSSSSFLLVAGFVSDNATANPPGATQRHRPERTLSETAFRQ